MLNSITRYSKTLASQVCGFAERPGINTNVTQLRSIKFSGTERNVLGCVAGKCIVHSKLYWHRCVFNLLLARFCCFVCEGELKRMASGSIAQMLQLHANG